MLRDVKRSITAGYTFWIFHKKRTPISLDNSIETGVPLFTWYEFLKRDRT